MRKTQSVKAYLVEKDTGYLNVEMELDAFFFPGGEPHVNQPDKDYRIHGSHVVVRVNGGNFEDYGLAITIADMLRQLGAARIDLFAPYFPAARQDRGAPFTLGVYAEILENYFNTIIVVDPHSPALKEVLPHAVVLMPTLPPELFNYAGNALEGPKTFSIIAPDEGATERAKAVADQLNLPLVQARKKRDPGNSFRIGSIECDPVETDIAIVVDDICDGGGTFLGLAEATGLDRERLRLWTTHGIYSKGTEQLYSAYSFIASTDSFPHRTTDSNKTVPVLGLLEDYYINERKSK